MIPLRQRSKYFSVVLGSWSIGSIIGLVVGGALVERISWRWCFYINIPFCIVGLIAVLFYIWSEEGLDLSLKRKIRQMDWVGAILFVGGIIVLLVGVSWGGT
jgi:MFS family permease